MATRCKVLLMASAKSFTTTLSHPSFPRMTATWTQEPRQISSQKSFLSRLLPSKMAKWLIASAFMWRMINHRARAELPTGRLRVLPDLQLTPKLSTRCSRWSCQSPTRAVVRKELLTKSHLNGKRIPILKASKSTLEVVCLSITTLKETLWQRSWRG